MEKSLYEQLVKKSLPFLESYKNDLLKWDKKEIENNYPERPFIHFTGSTGTTILTLYFLEDYPKKDERVPYLFGTADRWHILKGIKETLDALPGCNRMDLILYFNGKTLTQIDYKKAKVIVNEYQNKMRNLFSN